jgi:hypothetical protein
VPYGWALVLLVSVLSLWTTRLIVYASRICNFMSSEAVLGDVVHSNDFLGDCKTNVLVLHKLLLLGVVCQVISCFEIACILCDC